MIKNLRHHSHLTLLGLLGCITLASCAEADLPPGFEETPTREYEEVEKEYDDRDLSTTTPDDMTTPDMPADLGLDDMPDPVDMPVDMPDPIDMPVDMPDEQDLPDYCPPAPCTEGQVTCRGTSTFVQCLRDVDGCLGYGPLDVCPGSSTCIDDECVAPPECVDNDNDGYGENCAAGVDCDDSNGSVNPGMSELCDGIDNNCNNQVDENITGEGDACTSGQGQCIASGSLVCNPSARILECNASPSQPSAEVCDGLDNNCDGQIDEGNTCPCGEDPNEPNDSLGAAPLLSMDTPSWNFICDSDQDFYSLPSTLIDGQQYAAMIAFPAQLGELQLRLYKDGVASFTTPVGSDDHTGIRFTYDAASTYAVEVIHNGTQENFYRLNLIIEDTNCVSNPDFFEHNDTISTATLLPSSWLTDAYICDDEDDWYYLGEHVAGTSLQIETLFQAGVWDDGGDIDLELYGDPDGDNNFEIMEDATTGGDDEYLSYTTTHTGHFYLRVFAYDDTSNPYEIRLTTP